MKRLLLVAVLAAAGYFGYRYFLTSRPPIATDVISRLVVKQNSTGVSDLKNILGTSITSLVDKSTDLLNNATDGTAEPVINKAVSDLQDRVKELPAEEYKKVKYEFCKDVIPSPSPGDSL